MKPIEFAQLRQFYRTPPMPCPYLPGRLERKLFTMLAGPDANLLHENLSEVGFRRSHGIAYRPRCDSCNACVAVRVRVADFQPTRSMRRVLARNAGISAQVGPTATKTDHFRLFQRYQIERHGDGGMARMDIAEYQAMIEETAVDTFLVEYRDQRDELYAVCLSDRLRDGLSLVYSFFDPDAAAVSPGTYLIIWHIEEAKRLGLDYVYLGYWIANSPKMSYKSRFQPLEAYVAERWAPMRPSGSAV
jgi:arginyl-tRNA--protein-N-Asp/Glu arginylyltransferase